jgi:phage terminase large subunit GpA-like protein
MGFRSDYYDWYISSTKWSDRKRSYYDSHAKICLACGSEQDIHLHHHTYKRLGKELNSDLIPLCEKHHRQVHELHRQRGGSLTVATKMVIEEVSGGPILIGRPRKAATKRSRRSRSKLGRTRRAGSRITRVS